MCRQVRWNLLHRRTGTGLRCGTRRPWRLRAVDHAVVVHAGERQNLGDPNPSSLQWSSVSVHRREKPTIDIIRHRIGDPWGKAVAVEHARVR